MKYTNGDVIIYRRICPTCKDIFIQTEQEQIYCAPICEDFRDMPELLPKREGCKKKQYGERRTYPHRFYKLRFKILERDNFKCVYCGNGPEEGMKLHIDHLIPYSKGGKTELQNLVTACHVCNIGKYTKIIKFDLPQQSKVKNKQIMPKKVAKK